MQDEENSKEIAEMIRSGEYFKDARAWYSTCYHSPMSERNLYIVVTICAVTVTWFSISAFQSLFPLSPHVAFPLVVVEAEKMAADISPLAEDREDVNSALRRYFVRDYVAHRERYVIEVLENNVRRIRQTSSPEVYEEYRRYLSPQNPSSPVVLYERHTARDIALTRYSVNPFLDSEDVAEAAKDGRYKAVVEFEATTINSSKEEHTSHWVAEMDFEYQDAYVDQDNFDVSEMKFIVTRYAVREITGNTGGE